MLLKSPASAKLRARANAGGRSEAAGRSIAALYSEAAQKFHELDGFSPRGPMCGSTPAVQVSGSRCRGEGSRVARPDGMRLADPGRPSRERDGAGEPAHVHLERTGATPVIFTAEPVNARCHTKDLTGAPEIFGNAGEGA